EVLARACNEVGPSVAREQEALQQRSDALTSENRALTDRLNRITELLAVVEAAFPPPASAQGNALLPAHALVLELVCLRAGLIRDAAELIPVGPPPETGVRGLSRVYIIDVVDKHVQKVRHLIAKFDRVDRAGK